MNCLLYADYSQVELRCAAHVSQDPVFLQAYLDNGDLHLETAQAIFNDPKLTKENKLERSCGKTTNFLLIYNGSEYRLQDSLKEQVGMEVDISQARTFRKNFFQKYKVYADYLQRQKVFMLKHRVAISPFGRIRRLPELKFNAGLNYLNQEYRGTHQKELQEILRSLKPKDRFQTDRHGKRRPTTIFDIAKRKVKHALNQGYNFPIQSMAASIIKRAMIRMHSEGFPIINNVHDAILVGSTLKNAKKDMDRLKKIMENTVRLRVPLIAEFKVLRTFDESDVFEVL